jgi:urocanate hydratase
VLSNGGGVGTSKAINGGFGLVLDGSERVNSIIKSALEWDVNCGVSRRAWARNQNALETAHAWNLKNEKKGQITLPFMSDDEFLNEVIDEYLKK